MPSLSSLLSLASLLLSPLTLGAPTATCPPNLNTAGINLIKQYEGFRGSPYKDSTGKWTVGYGHLCKQDTECRELNIKFPMSQARALTLLQNDLKTYERCLRTAIGKTPALNANQYAALVSWTYNEGCGAMEKSTLIRRLNQGGKGNSPNKVARDELPKWVYAGGKKLQGLEKRRAAEVKLFTTKTGVKALPC